MFMSKFHEEWDGYCRCLCSPNIFFYQINPQPGVKLSSFVAVLAKNTCVYGTAVDCCYIISKLILIHDKGSQSLEFESQIIFQNNNILFPQANPHFGAKPSSCVIILAKSTCVCACGLFLHYYKINLFMVNICKAWALQEKLEYTLCRFWPGQPHN